MARLTKAQRENVRQMFDGRCAYCGKGLPDRWHADHVEPVVRYPVDGHFGSPIVEMYPERNRLDNYMPACAPCNIDKGGQTPEQWKKWLLMKLNNARKSPAFKLLIAFGLISDTGAEIVFHFERKPALKEPTDV